MGSSSLLCQGGPRRSSPSGKLRRSRYLRSRDRSPGKSQYPAAGRHRYRQKTKCRSTPRFEHYKPRHRHEPAASIQPWLPPLIVFLSRACGSRSWPGRQSISAYPSRLHFTAADACDKFVDTCCEPCGCSDRRRD